MRAQHPSALFWSQWAARDLPLRGRLQSAWHLSRCAACRTVAEQLRTDRAAYAQSAPFARGLADLQRRLPVAASRRPMWPAMALAGSLTAVLLAVWRPPEAPPILRAKGAATHFALYVQRGDAVSPLGTKCQAGDAVRARYQSPRPYLLVVEIDGRGDTQVVFPGAGAASGGIGPDRQITPGSWVLDDSPHQERFVALFSDAPLTLAGSRACVDAAPACDAAVIRLEVTCDKE